MEKHNLLILAEEILKASLQKNAIWNRASRDTEYKLQFKSGVITIDCWSDSYNQNLYDISLYNHNGSLIDQIAYNNNDDPESYHLLQKLHEEARRSFYKADETYSGIMSEITSGNKIGKENPDDVLPF